VSSLRPGARDLGLDVHWHYHFLGPGEAASSTPDALFLDVGRSLSPGVIDQHGDAPGAASTAELIVRFPDLAYNHLVGPWLEVARAGRELGGVAWHPGIATHRAPDFDAVVSTLLARHLVEHGGFPRYTPALVAYASEVDQGRYRVDLDRTETATHALHAALLALMNLPCPDDAGMPADEWRLRRGVDLVQGTLERVAAAFAAAKRPLHASHHLHPGSPGADSWRQDPANTDILELLEEDLALYRKDRATASLCEVVLPSRDGAAKLQVPALIASRPTESRLNKYWVRAEGRPYFICPLEEMGHVVADEVDGEPRYPRVIPSLDPTWTDPVTGRRPSLQGLGYRLERAEVRAREAAGGDDRGRTPRFGGGYCDNDDPWYDGRGHEHTIVDSPRSGTRLTYREVCEVATGPFWEVPLTECSVYLVSSGDPGAAPGGEGLPVPPPPGLTATLDAYFRDSRILEDSGAASDEPPPGFQPIEIAWRVFPQGTCPPMRILELRAVGTDSGATLEGLVAWCLRARGGSGGPPPEYVFAHLRLGTSFTPPGYCDRLLGLLGRGELVAFAPAADEREVVLFNSRAVFVRSVAPPVAPSSVGHGRDWELMLYAVFLSETATSFSRRITEALGDEELGDEDGPVRLSRSAMATASRLRKDFLAFQARYFQFDTTSHPYSRRLFKRLLDSMTFAEHYAEIQSELDRLYQIEERDAERRKQKSDSFFEFLLFFIGLFGVVQTVAAFHTMTDAQRSSVGLWQVVGASSLFLVLLYLLVRPWLRR